MAKQSLKWSAALNMNPKLDGKFIDAATAAHNVWTKAKASKKQTIKAAVASVKLVPVKDETIPEHKLFKSANESFRDAQNKSL